MLREGLAHVAGWVNCRRLGKLLVGRRRVTVRSTQSLCQVRSHAASLRKLTGTRRALQPAVQGAKKRRTWRTQTDVPLATARTSRPRTSTGSDEPRVTKGRGKWATTSAAAEYLDAPATEPRAIAVFFTAPSCQTCFRWTAALTRSGELYAKKPSYICDSASSMHVPA